MDGPDPMPTDTPLLEVLGRFDAMGYQGQARAVAGRAIECLTCHELILAADVDASRVVRLEGVSDPADMLLVVPIDCPHCDTLSTLVAQLWAGGDGGGGGGPRGPRAVSPG